MLLGKGTQDGRVDSRLGWASACARSVVVTRNIIVVRHRSVLSRVRLTSDTTSTPSILRMASRCLMPKAPACEYYFHLFFPCSGRVNQLLAALPRCRPAKPPDGFQVFPIPGGRQRYSMPVHGEAVPLDHLLIERAAHDQP